MTQAKKFNLVNIEEVARDLVDDARERSRKILQAAMKEADRIREDARTEGIELGRKEGREEGRKEGYEAGLAQGREEIDVSVKEVADALQSLLEAWEEDHRSLRQSAERDLLRLSFEIAKKILKREILEMPETVTTSIEKAVSLAVDAQRVDVHINPADQKAVETFFPVLKSRFVELESVNMVIDDEISRGGAVVKTESGEINADIAVQLREIERALLGSIEDEHPPDGDSEEPDADAL